MHRQYKRKKKIQNTKDKLSNSGYKNERYFLCLIEVPVSEKREMCHGSIYKKYD